MFNNYFENFITNVKNETKNTVIQLLTKDYLSDDENALFSPTDDIFNIKFYLFLIVAIIKKKKKNLIYKLFILNYKV